MSDETYTGFVEMHTGTLLRLAQLLTSDPYEAEDQVQEVLLSALRHWDKVTASDHPLAYVRRMLVNHHISSHRRRSSSEVATQPELLRIDDRGGSPHDRVDDRDWAMSVIRTLPATQRAVLVLRYYERLDDEDIARILDVARGTVRSLAARAFAALRSHPQLAHYDDPHRPPADRTIEGSLT